MEKFLLLVVTLLFGAFFMDLVVGFIESFTAQVSLFNTIPEIPDVNTHWQ